ncbi:MAG: molybdopterin-synthase adenylyltransferase MoeB [Pseudomonadota bacterium]|jgi:molybdopterin/thiamine biosynthesis adenylyltransferase
MIGLLGFAGLFFASRSNAIPRWLFWWLVVMWWVALLAFTLPVLLEERRIDPSGAMRLPAPFVGGDFLGWLTLGVLAGIIMAYRVVLRRIRARHVAPVAATQPALPTGALQPDEITRYARHITLREIGGPGQKALKGASVLVVGAGGLGAPALMYLAAAGVGTIGVIDDDVVEVTNLQRQIIHAGDRIGLPKVQSAMLAMQGLNPHVVAKPYNRRLTAEIAELVAEYDLVLDGSDNFDTRYLVNAACVAAGKPLIAAAITQWEGQVSLYQPAKGTPCFACVFPDRPAPGMVPTCAEAGVVGPLPGVIGTLMALEAIKLITGAGETLAGRLMLFDGLMTDTRFIKITRRHDCAVCGAV